MRLAEDKLFKINGNNKLYTLTVFGMAVILFLLIKSGQSNGQMQEQAKFVAQTAQNVQKGLDYFYQDQNRFPTVSEFESRQVMSSYLTVVPPLQLSSKNCASSFMYKRLSASSYQLSVCLPENYAQFHSGWNIVSEDRS